MEEINNGMMLVRLLKQITDGIRQNVELEFMELNLTGPQGMLVGILAHYGEMKISDLSERMKLSNSTISGIVDRLEKQGLVERTRSTEDRRVVYVKVTAEFKKKAKEHFNQIEEKFQSILNYNTTPEEVDKIFEGLNLLKELMKRNQQKKE
ncbi:transcriptional regulator, MarR family [Desulfonispora thiosulfatigenes DSM 11270]|uniref:Transcriptional regulator, MarR family n=1 Tax=Desulfonispora thiosulfatigenes DSM 11270 TaxID=656914 RepID=A0A1W1UFK6_DESTI|nr:MarR family transcriptional regulator [Desulfonispora thiosulfatigenes]SMB79574.1 transcriptional regulator, MarR family [Desulfonispora thiosulfatigenes DSM 11270]